MRNTNGENVECDTNRNQESRKEEALATMGNQRKQRELMEINISIQMETQEKQTKAPERAHKRTAYTPKQNDTGSKTQQKAVENQSAQR